MLHSVVDNIYVPLDNVFVTQKSPQEFDPSFDKNSQLFYQGTDIVDCMLHILSCVTFTNNTRGSL